MQFKEIMGFSEDISNFIKKTISNGDQVVRKTVIDISSSLIEKSPVGDPKYWVSLGASERFMNKAGTKRLKKTVTEYRRKPPKGYTGGHFRANWQLGLGALPEGEINRRDKNGGTTLNNIISNIPIKAANKLPYYIANNLPYAQALEDGHSRQAPYGMVSLTKTEFQSILSKVVKKVVK